MRSGFQRGKIIDTSPPTTTTKMADQQSSIMNVSELNKLLTQEEIEEGKVSLGEQMAEMRKTLTAININLTSLNASVADLNSSVHNLEEAKSELKVDFSKLRSDINNDMEVTRSSYEEKLTDLEKKVTEDYSIKYSEIVADLDAHKLEYRLDTTAMKNDIDNLTSLTATEGGDGNQLTVLKEIKDAIYSRDEKWDKLEAMLFRHIEDTNNRFEKLQTNIDANTELINQLEAHGRRWALRIIGLPAPQKGRIENTGEAKLAILKFLATKLDIKNIKSHEMDTAHRIGRVKDGKQTLLVRFFRRETVDFILGNKRMLKGEDLSCFQDTTRKNRTLIYDLNQRPEVESAWCQGVTIWAKLHSSANKFKVSITEDIDKAIHKGESTPKPTTNPPNSNPLPITSNSGPDGEPAEIHAEIHTSIPGIEPVFIQNGLATQSSTPTIPETQPHMQKPDDTEEIKDPDPNLSTSLTDYFK
jgi:hypothetical protein